MVFPTEAEPRAKRRALTLCQEHLRKVIDITRKTTQIIDSYVSNDKSSVKQLYADVLILGDAVDDSKRSVAQELAEIGAILLNREDYLRFTDVTSEIGDLCKGISFRILEMMEHRWEVAADLKKGIAELSGAVFDAISKLRETILTLNYGSPKIAERARDVEIAERTVDNLYRTLEIKTLESNLKINSMLLVRDIIQLLEDTADKIEDAADAARTLAFVI